MWFSKNKGPKTNAELDIIAKALDRSVKKIFSERTELLPHIKSTLERKKINAFMQRMRVDGLDKFTAPSFISTVNYYKSEGDLKKNMPMGALIVYVEQNYVAEFLGLLKYPMADSNNDDALKDACGTLANIIAGKFKDEMLVLGYQDLEMSHFSNYRNSAMHGVAFNPNEVDKYEISFFFRGTKRLVLELTLGPVPKK